MRINGLTWSRKSMKSVSAKVAGIAEVRDESDRDGLPHRYRTPKKDAL